ncbi:MAG: DUF1659 domain-containing protein [Clostridium sp.]|nr:DUF1659 domain-containing protein [Clostridium sp.]
MEIKTRKESKNLLLTFIREIKNDKMYFETRKIANLKVDATDDDVYAVASKIVELCEQESAGIKVQDLSLIESL